MGRATSASAVAAPRLALPKTSDVARRRIALFALGTLCLTYVALAVLVAAPESTVVLATVERSPDWLLGPWRAFGVGGASGALAGPLFYLGLWIATLAYVAILSLSRSIGPRLALGVIAGLHVLFLLAPPLLSQDVFSYISYARLDVVHHLSPYTHSPDDVPGDAAFAFAGSRDASSVYGPLFTIATYPLAKLSVPTAFWVLKSLAALVSLGVVALAWACAKRLGRDPVFVALAIGTNPLILVHVVGGAHNDALVVVLWLAAVLATLGVQERLGGFLSAAATGIKVSAGLVLPFVLVGARRKKAVIAGALTAAVATIGLSLAAFGLDAFDALSLIGQNQERTSRWSLPQRTADGIGALTGASPDTVVHFTRAGFGLAFIAVLILLLVRVWQEPPGSTFWITAAGWATLTLLLASAWLVPWYAIWLLPLAALSESRKLLAASVALTAYMLVIAVPL
jgi:hypothetical protein